MSKVCVSVTCPMCGNVYLLTMTNKQHERLEAGVEHIQDIFPEWSDDNRELLISGTCASCWNKLFGSDEDGDDYPFEEPKGE